MAMHKCFRVLQKSKPPSPYSILLECRGKEDTLLFENQAVAVLCKLIYLKVKSNVVLIMPFWLSRTRNGGCQEIIL